MNKDPSIKSTPVNGKICFPVVRDNETGEMLACGSTYTKGRRSKVRPLATLLQSWHHCLQQVAYEEPGLIPYLDSKEKTAKYWPQQTPLVKKYRVDNSFKYLKIPTT